MCAQRSLKLQVRQNRFLVGMRWLHSTNTFASRVITFCVNPFKLLCESVQTVCCFTKLKAVKLSNAVLILDGKKIKLGQHLGRAAQGVEEISNNSPGRQDPSSVSI